MNSEDKLIIAISSRALFNMDESHAVFEQQGLEAYAQYQIDHEDEVLKPGDAFPFVRKLLNLNELIAGDTRVEVILLSRNSADTGLRVFNSIEHYGLDITRAAFSGGKSPHRYVSAFGSHLFLSTDAEDVKFALDSGVAAATLLPSKTEMTHDEVRIAFDGDAVLFSDEAEQIYQSRGLKAFTESEKLSAKQPLSGGPFKAFLSALQRLQQEFPDATKPPIRTALVTARGAPAHERVIRTLRAWNIRIDESLFLGGFGKSEFLKAFGADVFFDDQMGHCDSASQHVATGHVPSGVKNQKDSHS